MKANIFTICLANYRKCYIFATSYLTLTLTLTLTINYKQNFNIMDFGKILGGLQSQLGDKVDLSSIKGPQDLGKLTEMLNGANVPAGAKDILAKLQSGGGIGDLDGDGVQESLAEELKGKAEQLLGGGVLGGLFGKH